MFDYVVAELDSSAAAALVSKTHALVLQQESLLLRLAAHWADLHHPDPAMTPESVLTLDGRPPGGERGVQLGGIGTPEVLEFAAAEFGARQETTSGAARSLMADALDLRHRLPQLWERVLYGRVRVWRARKVAQETRHLSPNAAAHVDQAVAGSIALLPWNRFETLLQAGIIEADPAAAETRAKIFEAERFVRAGSQRGGLKLLVARANAGDVIWFMGTVNRIAEILRLQGDLDSADVRRSRSIGILSQPAQAVQLLWDFRDEQHPAAPAPTADEPVANERYVERDLLTVDDAAADSQQLDGDGFGGERDGDRESPAHSALTLTAPVADPAALRPKVTLYVHISQEALLGHLCSPTGGGVARFEGVGPVTLGRYDASSIRPAAR